LTTVTVPPRRAPVDPRIRARRIEVRRRAGRRRLRWLLAALAASVLVAAAWAISRSPLLDVDAIVVVGAERTGAEAVLAAAGVAPGDQLLDVDLPAVRRGVGALPWVAEVVARRELPGTVRLAIRERVAVAVVGAGSEAVLVDAGGRALGPPTPVELADRLLPLVEGVDPTDPGGVLEPGARAAVEVAAALGPTLRDRLAAVEAAGGEVTLRLDDGARVRLGLPGDLRAQLESATTVLARVDLTCLAVIDVRVPAAPAVSRRSLTEDPACP